MFNQETTSEKTPVVSIVNNQPITTSLNVAEVFGKFHKNVIRDINDLIEKVPEAFAAANFEPNKIKVLNNPSGEEISHYKLTRDGWTLLVFGYSGERAMQFKLAYLKAFNKMEEALRNQLRALPAPAEYKDGFIKGLRFERELRAAMLNYDIDDATVRNLCFYRTIGLSQPEAFRLCIINKRQGQRIEQILKRYGCKLPMQNPSTRKLRVRQAWENLLEGLVTKSVSAPECREVANG